MIDHYWQTETGWPILTAVPGVEQTPNRFGSPSFPAYGYDLQLLRETDASACGTDEKGVVAIVPPLPPGVMTTVWGDDERFVKTYFGTFATKQVYSTFDWGIRDKDGYYFILGRTDDVINVAGHRLGTREIEEAVSAHPNVAEVAVVGVADQLKGQMPLAFAVVKDVSKVASPEGRAAQEKEVMATVDKLLGAIARPARVHFVTAAAEDALGQAAAALDPGACRGARSGRSHHDRGPGGAGADQGPPSRAATDRESGAGLSCSRFARAAQVARAFCNHKEETAPCTRASQQPSSPP